MRKMLSSFRDLLWIIGAVTTRSHSATITTALLNGYILIDGSHHRLIVKLYENSPYEPVASIVSTNNAFDTSRNYKYLESAEVSDVTTRRLRRHLIYVRRTNKR